MVSCTQPLDGVTRRSVTESRSSSRWTRTGGQCLRSRRPPTGTSATASMRHWCVGQRCEAVAHYMQAVYWVRLRESDGLQPTRLGAALVRGLGSGGVQPPVGAAM
jgi:hypothetical protein